MEDRKLSVVDNIHRGLNEKYSGETTKNETTRIFGNYVKKERKHLGASNLVTWGKKGRNFANRMGFCKNKMFASIGCRNTNLGNGKS